MWWFFLALVAALGLILVRVYVKLRAARSSRRESWDEQIVGRLRSQGYAPFNDYRVDFFLALPDDDLLVPAGGARAARAGVQRRREAARERYGALLQLARHEDDAPHRAGHPGDQPPPGGAGGRAPRSLRRLGGVKHPTKSSITRTAGECRPSALLGLALDRFGGGGDGLRIAEVAAAERLELRVELVEKRNPGGDVELDDLALGDPVQHLHHGAQAVAVRDDEDARSRAQLGSDARVPQGQDARERVGERLGGGKLARIDAGVARVEARVARIVARERRRRNVVAAAPDLHLILAVAGGGLGLVEPLQRSVVTLVQPPAPLDRHPHAMHLLVHRPERADRALQYRGEGDVRGDTRAEQLAARLAGLGESGVREIHIGPAGEQVFQVPGALAVTDQDQSSGHSSYPASLRTDSTPTVSVAKSPAPAARMSASVRCQSARSLPADSAQALTRASALPRPVRASTRSLKRRWTRSAASRSPVRAIACHGPSTASFSIRARSQSKPLRVPTSK